jgi:hypothetical protein
VSSLVKFNNLFFLGTATIFLLGTKTDANPDGFGTKVLAGFPGSQIDIHGAVRRPSWTVLGSFPTQLQTDLQCSVYFAFCMILISKISFLQLKLQILTTYQLFWRKMLIGDPETKL